MGRHKIIVVIPSYNELETLKNIIISVNKLLPVMVIDDGSDDGTCKFLKKKKILYIRNNKRIGYENSLIKSFKYIIKCKKKISHIITMDADGEHLPKDLKKFIKLTDYNLVIGKRDNFNRKIEYFISYIFKKKFKLLDPLSGFKMYSVKILKKIKKFNQNYFLVDLASYIISLNKKKCINVSIKVKKRIGDSKLNKIFQLYFKMINIILFIYLFTKYENRT